MIGLAKQPQNKNRIVEVPSHVVLFRDQGIMGDSTVSSIVLRAALLHYLRTQAPYPRVSQAPEKKTDH